MAAGAATLLLALAALLPPHTLGSDQAMRPVIGILTDPIGTNSTATGAGWMGISMTKWFESAGAQVVPIPYNADEGVISDLFMSLNGVAFQGGDMPDAFSPTAEYYQSAKYLYTRVLQANAGGDVFPLWGSCLGMQLIALLASEGDEQIVQCGYDSENLALKLNFTSLKRDGTFPEGSLFGSMPPEISQSFASSAFTLNYHHCGVPPLVAANSLGFKMHFDVMSVNVDRNGKEFVSSIQARGLDPIGTFWAPIFATQFHPELQMDGAPWCGDDCISNEAMAASQALANEFVDAARKSTHTFEADSFNKIASYNHEPFGRYEQFSSYGYYYVTRDGGHAHAQSTPTEAELDALREVAVQRSSGGMPISPGQQQKRQKLRGAPPPPKQRPSAGLGPIIGVLSVPDPPCVSAKATATSSSGSSSGGSISGGSIEQTPELSCFSTFYADWLHTNGARVVPIPYTANDTRLRGLFNSVQGLLYTGGGADVTSHTSQ